MSPHGPLRTYRRAERPVEDGALLAPVPATAGLTRTDVEVLQGAADSRNLRAAAKRAGLTQRAAERRLARLERRLGVQLVDPGADDLQLTAAGERLLSAASRFRAELSRIVSQVLVRPDSGGPDRLSTLRLAGIGRSWEDWVIDDLASRLDRLVLTVLSADPAEGRRLFERQAVDAVYLWQVPGEEITLDRRSATLWVFDEPLWVILPDRHPAARQADVALADLADDEWVVGPWPGLDLLTSACAEAGFRPRIGAVSASRSVRRSLLLHGHRVGLVSPVSAPPLGDASVVRRPLRERVTRRHLLHVDPTVVGPSLHALLRDRLRRGYLAVAAVRNPEYVASPAFPVVKEDLSDVALRADPGELTGLPSHSDGRRARAAGPELEPDDLYLLRAIASCGSINRAAALLSITQPALSRRLSRLEARLDLRLLVRGPRGATLTDVGRRLVDLAAGAEATFHAAVAGLRSPPPAGPTGVARPHHLPPPRSPTTTRLTSAIAGS
jgi:DNA-binding transcriptional LysR family regulator